jgi:hypothetical protein
VEIVGRFNFTLGEVNVTLGNIDWTTDPGGVLNPPPNVVKTYGSFDLATSIATRTGVFADPDFGAVGLGPDLLPIDGFGVPPLEPEKIQDMSANPVDANYFPVGTPVSISSFLILAERPTWDFIATFLVPGTAGTPFLLSQNGNNVDASISINGRAVDSATPTLFSNWTAIISAQYTNTTVAAVLAAVIAGTLPVNTWSGTFEATPIPEPMTLLTFGAGASALAAYRRRRRAAKR